MTRLGSPGAPGCTIRVCAPGVHDAATTVSANVTAVRILELLGTSDYWETHAKFTASSMLPVPL
jgi:hypothetical protein